MVATEITDKQLHRVATLVALSGLVLSAMWAGITVLSVPTLSAAWIVQIVLTVLAWFQLANVNRTVTLNPLVWAFVSLSVGAGVVGYTLSLAGVSHTIVSVIAGFVGGGVLIITALVARQGQTINASSPHQAI